MKPLDPEGEYELIIKTEDNGLPRKSQTARLNVVVVPILQKSSIPPKIKTADNVVEVTESDKPGFLVTLIQATDEDSDHLWYNISGNVHSPYSFYCYINIQSVKYYNIFYLLIQCARNFVKLFLETNSCLCCFFFLLLHQLGAFNFFWSAYYIFTLALLRNRIRENQFNLFTKRN